MKLKRAIAVSAVLFTFAAPGAFADQTYQTRDFQFKYPPKCSAPANPSTSPVLKCDGFAISVSQILFKAPMSLDEFAKRNLSSGSAAYKLIDEGRTTMGHKEVAYTVGLTGATSSTKSIKYAFVTGKAGYTVSYSALVKEFQRNSHAVETVVKSFKEL